MFEELKLQTQTQMVFECIILQPAFLVLFFHTCLVGSRTPVYFVVFYVFFLMSHLGFLCLTPVFDCLHPVIVYLLHLCLVKPLVAIRYRNLLFIEVTFDQIFYSCMQYFGPLEDVELPVVPCIVSTSPFSLIHAWYLQIEQAIGLQNKQCEDTSLKMLVFKSNPVLKLQRQQKVAHLEIVILRLLRWQQIYAVKRRNQSKAHKSKLNIP